VRTRASVVNSFFTCTPKPGGGAREDGKEGRVESSIAFWIGLGSFRWNGKSVNALMELDRGRNARGQLAFELAFAGIRRSGRTS
jgi:hypothetical protein